MSITLKTPIKDTGYGSKESGLPSLFALSVDKCKRMHFNNIRSSVKSGTSDRKKEVAQINSAYNKARETIAQDILDYLIQNDGVVDAWPNPAGNFSMGFQLEENYDSDKKIDYDSYYYGFNYFTSDFKSNQYGLITGGEMTYRNEYKYKDTQRLRSIKIHENNLLDEFKENNPLKFGWSLLVGFMILLCFGGPILSTVYLYFLQRAADPEVVELAVEAFAGKFNWIFTLFDAAPKIIKYILSIVLFVPFAFVMLLKLIPEAVCFIAGKSTIVLVIYGILLFVSGFMAFGMIYAFVGERIPKAKPIYGLQCLISYMQSKFSKERKEAVAENERLREEYTELMEDFHHRWYSYAIKHK